MEREQSRIEEMNQRHQRELLEARKSFNIQVSEQEKAACKERSALKEGFNREKAEMQQKFSRERVELEDFLKQEYEMEIANKLADLQKVPPASRCLKNCDIISSFYVRQRVLILAGNIISLITSVQIQINGIPLAHLTHKRTQMRNVVDSFSTFCMCNEMGDRGCPILDSRKIAIPRVPILQNKILLPLLKKLISSRESALFPKPWKFFSKKKPQFRNSWNSRNSHQNDISSYSTSLLFHF